MVENYWDGWKELNEVKIPPVEKNGFKQDVIIRQKVEAVSLRKPEPEKTKIVFERE